jgi:hypothetical protein
MADSTPPSHRPTTQLPLPRRELRGVVERITYQHPETGYTVARLAPERVVGERGRDPHVGKGQCGECAKIGADNAEISSLSGTSIPRDHADIRNRW